MMLDLHIIHGLTAVFNATIESTVEGKSLSIHSPSLVNLQTIHEIFTVIGLDEFRLL